VLIFHSRFKKEKEEEEQSAEGEVEKKGTPNGSSKANRLGKSEHVA
jgi:hypothetical protein